MRSSDADRAAAASAAVDAAARMRRFDPGPMAELRRMTPENPAPAFWRVAVDHRIMQYGQPAHRDWVTILRLLALLTPKGDPPLVHDGPEAGQRVRPRLHDPRRPLGQVLCDGGDPDWKPTRTPADGVVSERRLVMLLATRGQARADALERAVRMIARGVGTASNGKRLHGIDVTQIAAAILWPDQTALIAEAYFKRLDRAARAQLQENQT